MMCAIYCRLSKEDGEKAEESESIQNQKSLLIRYAEDRRWDIYAIYSDEDYSGADQERPGFGAMLKAARARAFQIVLCKTQSRFTRELEMVEKYIHGLFPLWGIRFVAVLDNVDTDVKGNKKARQINGLINEWYLEDLSENIRAVLDQKRRQGKYIGSFPAYGYQKDPGDHNHLLVDQEAAEVVRQIFRLYLSGLGTHAIAGRLSGQGVLSPAEYKQAQGLHYVNGNAAGRGARWNHTSVARILKNEVYLGNLVQGRKRKVSYKSKKLCDVPSDQWIRVEGTHTAIIDRASFDAVQRRLGGRVRADGSGKPHLLAGKVRCMDCGSVMQRLTHTYKGVPKSYLQCKRYAATRKQPECSGHTVRLDLLTDAVRERICGYAAACYELSGVQRFRVEFGGGQRGARVKKEIASLQRQEARLRQAVTSLYLDKVDGLLTGEQFVEMNAALQQDRQTAVRRRTALEVRLLESDREEIDEDSLCRGIGELLRFRTLDRELVDMLIDTIEVGEKDRETGEQRVNINWNI